MDARVVVEGGAIVHAEGDRSDVPWWSVTKTAIAAAALTLVGEGRLDLDAPFAGRAYTLRQLLQHRSGLRDYGAMPAYQEAVARHDRRAAWPSTRAAGAAAVGGRADRARTGRGELAPAYDSGWVYHGSLIGPVIQAALFLHRLLSGGLLQADLLAMMIDPLQLPGVPPGRCVIAVYRSRGRRLPRSPAAPTRRRSSKTAWRCLCRGHDSRRHRPPRRLARPPRT